VACLLPGFYLIFPPPIVKCITRKLKQKLTGIFTLPGFGLLVTCYLLLATCSLLLAPCYLLLARSSQVTKLLKYFLKPKYPRLTGEFLFNCNFLKIYFVTGYTFFTVSGILSRSSPGNDLGSGHGYGYGYGYDLGNLGIKPLRFVTLIRFLSGLIQYQFGKFFHLILSLI
jgi:hypothetical protein